MPMIRVPLDHNGEVKVPKGAIAEWTWVRDGERWVYVSNDKLEFVDGEDPDIYQISTDVSFTERDRATWPCLPEVVRCQRLVLVKHKDTDRI